MATTTTNLIVPEIYSEVLREKFEGRVKVLPLAKSCGYLLNTNVGEKVVFPKFNAISDAEEVTKGKQTTIEQLNQKSSEAIIKMVDKIVRVFDMDDMTALGNFIEEAGKQQSIVFARKLDSDLVEEAKKTSLKHAVATGKAITADELNTALGLFGDEQDVEDMAGIVVNSLCAGSFYNMSEFVGTRTDTVQGNGIVRNGMIGYFRGIPVFMSDKGTYDTKLNECITLIIKKDALGYMLKRNVDVVEEREEKLHCSDIVGSLVYAVKLLSDDGVVMCKKTIA